MKRTLAATMIVKNELHNLPRVFKSLSGLVDCLYITDTGSSDGTVEYLRSEQAMIDAGCPVNVFFYQWNDDFGSARNHNICMIKEDYWMWVDADDVVCVAPGQREFFLAWKNSAMDIAEAWFVPYRYAFNEKGESVCSFVRERVFKTKLNFKFQDFIHEGIKIPDGTNVNGINTWTIDHLRTADEAQLDKGRNLSILLKNSDKLTSRLKFYLGKEYFDSGDFQNAANNLREVVKKADLNPGDRVLAFQYLVHSLITTKSLGDALEYCMVALNLDPLRAEFHCFMGDIYLGLNEPMKAIPFYQAAKYCVNRGDSGMSHEFSFTECYNSYPRTNLAKIYYNIGEFERCIEECRDLNTKDGIMIFEEAKKAMHNLAPATNAIECDDIIITCPAQGAYPWNEKIYLEKGLGGSETAAIEMALWLKHITKRQVRIFNNCSEMFIGKTGVEYRPAAEVYDYFRKWKPKLHIAWRHSAKLTDAPSYIWCHDLVTPGADNLNVYDKIMALSDFHSEFLMANLGIPKNKIMRTRNGIDPSVIKETRALNIDKQYGKVIWPNSPDRGLEHAIRIMDKVKLEIPEAELHVFYGIENLTKYGLKEKADELTKMIEARPWVKYVGNVTKNRLMQEFASSQVWLYPATFIETFCISALESVLMDCWPVVREFGALNSTMKEFKEKGLCDIHDMEVHSEEDIQRWADLVIDAIKQDKWKTIKEAKLDLNSYSWESVSREWIETFKL